MTIIIITGTTPRVWPACLNCYNNGRLVGQWVDCADAAYVTLEQLHEGAGGPDEGCEEIWCVDHGTLEKVVKALGKHLRITDRS